MNKTSETKEKYILSALRDSILFIVLFSFFGVIPLCVYLLSKLVLPIFENTEDLSDLLFISIYIIAFLIIFTYSYFHKKEETIAANRKQETIDRNLYFEKKEAELQQRIKREEQAMNLLFQEEEFIHNLIEEKKQTFPWFASMYTDFQAEKEKHLANYYKHKSRPAIKAAEQIKKISSEKKAIQTQCKMYEYQLNFYESLFPWLEEFKEIPPKEATLYITKEYSSDENILRKWLSPEEYSQLSNIEKNQLALDRYKSRNKTNWEIGVEFERYVGYLYEQKGYKVTYQGALSGLEDMGRDLIATKGNQCLVVQCKRWSKTKTIHEKHIFQLYGTMILMQIQNPNKNIKGIFVSTTALSETAQKCADYLNIKIAILNNTFDYPLIKCNISRKDGSKIYHLPFDQQYDKITIEPDKGEFFAYTVAEAENAGFRHAYKWHYNN